MNWMIDGVYGEDYRIAMGYPLQQPHDEWDIERMQGAKERPARSATITRIATNAFNRLTVLVLSAVATLHQPERKVS